MIANLERELAALEATANLRHIPQVSHEGKWLVADGQRMLNLSSNDYMGVATHTAWNEEFVSSLHLEEQLFTSSSSRLLTGNFAVFDDLEDDLAQLYGRSALVFNSGYHANIGILPALAHSDTLILADKLVHASIIDGLRLSTARYMRYRHNDMAHLSRLLEQYAKDFRQVIVVTESIFSMDGDEADLQALVGLKQHHPHLMLYVDEAHAFGVRGRQGLGCAEEQGLLDEIDIIVGTFGKAAASFGAFAICAPAVRIYLINKMRSVIFTTALPPVNVAWTRYVLSKLVGMEHERKHFALMSRRVREHLAAEGRETISTSHIIPIVVGDSAATVIRAEQLRRHGFYVLPIRPPTVPEGTSRIRLSLTAALTDEEISTLITRLS